MEPSIMDQLERVRERLTKLRVELEAGEAARAVSLAITKTEEAMLWLAAAEKGGN